jgi:heavy metal efflux system protein
LIERLLVYSIKHRLIVFLLTGVFILLGVLAASRVAIDAVPDVTNVQVQVITSAPTLGPIDIETFVTAPLERAMAGLPHLEEVRSISRAGISVVTVVFDDDMELTEARNHVNQRMTEAQRDLPKDADPPQLGPLASGLGEIYHFEVKGDAVPLMQRRTALDWQIGPRLRLVPGVVEVNAFGGEARTMEVALDSQKLASRKLGVPDVLGAIERNHLNGGGAYMVDGRENVTIRGDGRVHSVEELGNIVVFADGAASASDSAAGAVRLPAAPIYLHDVADIREAPMVRYGAVTRDGRKQESVVGVVMMLKGASSEDTAKAVKATLDELSSTLPAGITIDGYYDRTELVHRTIGTVRKNLLEASILVVVVLFLTLGNLRAGSIVAMAIPLALLGVFIGMWLFNVHGNLISLGAIDFGLVVDGAIIIVENALRHLAERTKALGRPLTADERQDVVLVAAKEVRGATAFGEAMIALVYLPLLALGGVEGRTFKPMALTVLFALGAAFVLSLTFVPALASLLLPKSAKEHEAPLLNWLQRAYTPVLDLALRWPKAIVSTALILFAGSVGLALSMGREFLPTLDEGTMVLAMVRLPSVSLEQSLALTRKVEVTLKAYPEVTSVVSRTGRAEVAVDPMGINMTDVYVMLKPREQWTSAHDREALIALFEKSLADSVPGAQFAYSQPIEMNTNDLLAGSNADLAVRVYGHDPAILKRLGAEIADTIRDIPGAKDVRMEQIAGTNVLTITPDRVLIARAGLDVKDVMDTIAAVGGVEVGSTTDGPIRVPIHVRFTETSRENEERLRQLPLRARDGSIHPLGQVSKIDIAPGPSQMSRERLSRRLTVEANVRGRDIASFVEEAQARMLKREKPPSGYSVEWSGEYERLQGATKQLAIIIPIALSFILVLLFASFGTARPALLIFLNVPISLSGGVALLAVRGMPLSVSAGVGFIALFGVAVLNGLVLISSVERLREEGLSIASAARDGALGRLRPVITTALVASLGFLPMAIATGAGAEVQRPLATVVIGGLLTSTILTLFVLPALYKYLGERVERARLPAAAPAVEALPE